MVRKLVKVLLLLMQHDRRRGRLDWLHLFMLNRRPVRPDQSRTVQRPVRWAARPADLDPGNRS